MTTTTISTVAPSGTTTGDECSQPWLIGNGKCNDETNNLSCDFDGGDCCIECTVKTDCTDCICKQDNTIHPDCSKCNLQFLILKSNNLCGVS